MMRIQRIQNETRKMTKIAVQVLSDEEVVLFKDDIVTKEPKDTGSKLMATTEEEHQGCTHTTDSNAGKPTEPTTE